MQEKKVQVVMVPHEKGVVISLKDGRNTLPAVQTPPKEGTTESNWKQANHLYFMSDDVKRGNRQLSEGVWCYRWYDKSINQHTGEIVQYKYGLERDSIFLHEIIAATDVALQLPFISKEWIRTKYVPANGAIKEVKLKVVHPDPIPDEIATEMYFDESFFRLKLELTSGNEVIVIDDSVIPEKCRKYHTVLDVANLCPECKSTRTGQCQWGQKQHVPIIGGGELIIKDGIASSTPLVVVNSVDLELEEATKNLTSNDAHYFKLGVDWMRDKFLAKK